MRYTLTIPAGLLVAVMAVAVVVLMASLSTDGEPPSGVQAVREIKRTIMDLRQTCAAGRLHDGDAWAAGRPPRGSILPVMLEKLRYRVVRQMPDRASREQVLAIVDRADTLLYGPFASAYSKAWKSRLPQDARGLVPLLDDLDEQMSGLLRLLP